MKSESSIPKTITSRLFDVTGAKDGTGAGYVLAFINEEGTVSVEHQCSQPYIRDILFDRLSRNSRNEDQGFYED